MTAAGTSGGAGYQQVLADAHTIAVVGLSSDPTKYSHAVPAGMTFLQDRSMGRSAAAVRGWPAAEVFPPPVPAGGR